MQKTMQKITEPLADAGIFHLLLYLPNFATVHRKWLTSQNCSHKFGTLRLWCRNYHKISLVSCKQTALKKNGVPDPISNKTLIQYMELEASCLYIYIYIYQIYIYIYIIYISYIYIIIYPYINIYHIYLIPIRVYLKKTYMECPISNRLSILATLRRDVRLFGELHSNQSLSSKPKNSCYV